MLKKILAVLLAAAMLAAMGVFLSGCSEKEIIYVPYLSQPTTENNVQIINPSTEDTRPTIGLPEVEMPSAPLDGTSLKYEETFTINYWIPDNTDLDMEGCYTERLIEDTINCDLQITEYASRDQYETLIAQKKIPALTFAQNPAFGYAYGPLGAYIDWNDYIDQMPNVKKMLEMPEYQKEMAYYTMDDGAMYQLPCLQTGYASNTGWLYRKDIFDKHGLTFPTNQEELMATLRRLKELYPNSYPFVLRGLNGFNLTGLMNMARLFGGSYDNPNTYNTLYKLDPETKTYYMAQTSDGMRECLSWLNDLYEEGLLHPSCITLDNWQWAEAFASNTSFIGYDKMDRIDILTEAAIDANHSYVLTGARNFPMGSNNDSTFSMPVSNASLLVSGLLETEELEQVLKYVDWLFSEEGIQVTNWGKEGESYQQLADGTYDFKPEFTYSYNGSGLGVVGLCVYRDFDVYLKSQMPHVVEAIHEVAKDYTDTTPEGFFLTYEESEQRIFDNYQKTYALCQAKFQEFILGRYHNGKEPDTADWDAFVREVEASLPAEVMQIHKDALARYLEKHPEA